MSYAFAEKVADSIYHQVFDLLPGEIFFHIPVLVTTARLFRLRENVSVKEIKSASDVGDVANQHDVLVLKNRMGVHLERHNQAVFDAFQTQVDIRKLASRLSSFTEDLEHFFSVLSRLYCPSAFVIVHHDESCRGFTKLFDYVKELIEPSELLRQELFEHKLKQEEFAKHVSAAAKDKQNNT